MEGREILSLQNLPISSAAICCASAALPPLPQIKILFPFLKELRHISAIFCTTGIKSIVSSNTL